MKRVLYTAYYFPPAGGPGVQRTLKFVRYLPGEGWLPTVVSVDPEYAAWPAVDESMLAEIPAEVDVHRTRSWDPYTAYARLRGRSRSDSVGVGFADDAQPGFSERVARFIRANVFLPDARVGWVPHAKRCIRGLAGGGRKSGSADAGAGTAGDTAIPPPVAPFDAIITTGPPHSTHWIGAWAQKHLGLPWLADFRDPWSELSYYDQLPFLPWSRAFDRRAERRVLEQADGVITVSDAVAELLRAKTDTPVVVIPNGYDPEDFEGVEPRGGGGSGAGAFRIVHVGTLTEKQNAPALWEAVAGLRAEGRDIHIHLVGRVDSSVMSSLQTAGLADAVDRTPYVPHREAIAYMKGADLLLLFVPRTENDEGILTGKVFEYMASGRPVLGLGPVPSDVSRLLEESGAGRMVGFDAAGEIRGFLGALLAGGGRARGADPGYLRQYTRPALAARLAEELDRIAR